MNVVLLLPYSVQSRNPGPYLLRTLAAGLCQAGAKARVLGVRSGGRRGEISEWTSFVGGALLADVSLGELSRPAKALHFLRHFRLGGFFAQACANLVRQLGPMVVVCYDGSYLLYEPVRRWAAQSDIPIVAHLIEKLPPAAFRLGKLNPSFWERRLFDTLTLPRVDGLVGITSYWEVRAKGLGLPFLRIPVNTRADLSPSNISQSSGRREFMTLSFLGNIKRRELPFTLLEGAREAIERGIPLRVVFVGSADQSKLRRKVVHIVNQDPRLRSAVTFTDWLEWDAMRVRLTESDSFVILRDNSEESRACLAFRLPEMLSVGRPVIQSAAGDVPLYFENRRNAWLIPPGHEPQALASAIEEIWKEPILAQQVGLAGAETAKREFDWRQNGLKLYQFLASLKNEALRPPIQP